MIHKLDQQDLVHLLVPVHLADLVVPVRRLIRVGQLDQEDLVHLSDPKAVD